MGDFEVSEVQGAAKNLALHSLGWKAFQDLCGQVCEEILKRPVSVYREAQDGGQDAVFLARDASPDGLKIGTVQCKFVSDPARRLRASDVNAELDTIELLLREGKAHSYIFITSMGVDAPVADKIRKQLFDMGVVEPEVFGKEWLTLKISESSRLRALVPRVYGLGDLSTILDERRAEQTKALLGHLMPSLGVYVPTASHRRAVKVLSEHGLVLLLGAPATGKSTLAAILATAALDSDGHKCFQLDGPNDLATHWNPNENGRLYWIDDAFGPNQLRNDYIDSWISIMNKVKTAISCGNRFILTSRTHIWNAARSKLGTRNHPLLANSQAVVDVGSLRSEEKAQMLYNHLKAGNQSSSWKGSIKEYLEDVSKNTNFLPEIARRLGDKNYTSGIKYVPGDLIRFVAKPKEFLKETILELDPAHQAALTLVFLYRSRLPTSEFRSEQSVLVTGMFGVSVLELDSALEQLKESFVAVRDDPAGSLWAFVHPTIADALSEILAERKELVELYIRGTAIETLLAEAVCDGEEVIRDAVVIPASMADLLISRLLETPNETNLNSALFNFLCDRASPTVLKSILALSPQILARQVTRYWRLSSDPTICLFARAHHFGVLPQKHQTEAEQKLEEALTENLDASFLDNDEILALFRPTKLLEVFTQLLDQIGVTVSEKICTLEGEADSECDPYDHFYEVRSFVETMKGFASRNEALSEKIYEVESEMDLAIQRVEEEQKRKTVDWDGDDVIPQSVVPVSTTGRSIFSDVDE